MDTMTDSADERTPQLTIRGSAEARRLEIEERLRRQKEALGAVDSNRSMSEEPSTASHQHQDHQEIHNAPEGQPILQPGSPHSRQSIDEDREQPVASTSARTLDEDGEQPGRMSSHIPLHHRQQQQQWDQNRPWPLADFGIPKPSRDIEPDPIVVAKLRHFHSLRQQNVRFNASLQANKSFRNPSILSKLVDFVAVDEKKSAFPQGFWSSSAGLGPESWAEAISAKQKRISEERQRAQERGKRSNIEFTTAGSSSSSGGRPKQRLNLDSNSTTASSNSYAATTNANGKQRYDDDYRRHRGAESGASGSSNSRRDRDRDRDVDRHRDRPKERRRSRSPTWRR